MTGREIVDYAFDVGGWVVVPNTPSPVSFDELFRQSIARIIDTELGKQKAEARREAAERVRGLAPPLDFDDEERACDAVMDAL